MADFSLQIELEIKKITLRRSSIWKGVEMEASDRRVLGDWLRLGFTTGNPRLTDEHQTVENEQIGRAHV